MLFSNKFNGAGSTEGFIVRSKASHALCVGVVASNGFYLYTPIASFWLSLAAVSHLALRQAISMKKPNRR